MTVAPRVLQANCKDPYYLVLVKESLLETNKVLGVEASLVLGGSL